MSSEIKIEKHPFAPFVPQGARVLMLGTFPPKAERWSMPFYYPNRINDFWRMCGLVFYGERDKFVDEANKTFHLPEIKQFLTEQGIALSDTAVRVRRLKDNASDKFLEIVEPINLEEMLSAHPSICAIVTTGEKATGVIAGLCGVQVPKIGVPVPCSYQGHTLTLWRMPSTSRAYPLALPKKAAAYRQMFAALGFQVAE